MAREQHRATARVLDIMERLAESDNGLTLTELAELLDAPKSSILPILRTLMERSYLRQKVGTGQYVLGLNVYVLGAASSFNGGIEPIVEVMKDIVVQCQETCQLGILDQGNVLYLAKEDSPHMLRMISRIGKRLPANATAIGKALLSGLSDDMVRKIYQNGLPSLTAQTITDMDELLHQLTEIRAGKLAHEREESTPQLACWAVPLRQNGHIFAALSITVPLFRCPTEKEEQVCRCLLAAKREIEQMAEIRDFHLITE